MLVEYPRDRESEKEGREHGVTLGELREEHQGEQHAKVPLISGSMTQLP
jgi:hypothetical protein